MKLGIVGFGDFCQFWVEYFQDDFEEIFYYSRRDIKRLYPKTIIQTDIETVCSADYIMIGVVVQHFEETIEKMKPYLKSGTVVFDVCSVKKIPATYMLNLLPNHINIIATHPLFGPKSGKNGIENLNIMLDPLRCSNEKYKFLHSVFKNSMKLNILNMDCDQHDKEMSHVQALTHFIARGIKGLGGLDSSISAKTKGYEALLTLENNIGLDSFSLFESIENYNPYATTIRKEFIKSLEFIDKELDKK
jgi:prephenate dehydrogenase